MNLSAFAFDMPVEMMSSMDGDIESLALNESCELASSVSQAEGELATDDHLDEEIHESADDPARLTVILAQNLVAPQHGHLATMFIGTAGSTSETDGSIGDLHRAMASGENLAAPNVGMVHPHVSGAVMSYTNGIQSHSTVPHDKSESSLAAVQPDETSSHDEVAVASGNTIECAGLVDSVLANAEQTDAEMVNEELDAVFAEWTPETEEIAAAPIEIAASDSPLEPSGELVESTPALAVMRSDPAVMQVVFSSIAPVPTSESDESGSQWNTVVGSAIAICSAAVAVLLDRQAARMGCAAKKIALGMDLVPQSL